MSDAPAVPAPAPEPVLRSLAPQLTKLEKRLRGWLGSRHNYPLAPQHAATLESLASDLRRQADELAREQPLLVVMLMGGTGVGKSTLLNALAGGAIAHASFARPTTRDPVVYYHEAVKPDRFDPLLRTCHLATHDRPPLLHKILVDTPDIDSNDLANRDKLLQLLPVADVVLYVGSQEKYHDQLGWQVFLEQRKRRAFAFVLNKWDRCLHSGAQGLRPDEDLLRDLKNEGFKDPQLFRTCAQFWVDRVSGDGAPEPPKGEQFVDLVAWLELGLNALEIQAIKARGISQLFEHLQKTLDEAKPPDLTVSAAQTRTAWEKVLGEESHSISDVLLNTLEPYQREIEHHFTVESYKRFRGMMGGYLNLFTRVRYAGTSLRDRISFMPRSSGSVDTPVSWDLAKFTRACSAVAGERHLDARSRALSNRLLVEADRNEFPLDLLTVPTEDASRLDWRQRYAQALIDVLTEVETKCSRPRGFRRFLHGLIVFLGNTVPVLAFFGACAVLLWRFFMTEGHQLQIWDFILPFAVVLIVLILFHFLISAVLPLRWPRIRGEFHGRLEKRLTDDLCGVYATIPSTRAEGLQVERGQVENIEGEVKEVASWLEQRREAASIAGLYGN